MSMEAAAECPKCKNIKQDIMSFLKEGRWIYAVRLHCRSCEHIWVMGTWPSRPKDLK